MICVYDIGNENYETNGNAVLCPKECRIKNTAGGSYDLTMTHPIDPDGKWTHLQPGAIIKAPIPEEEIENAFAGYDADVYKTVNQAELREGPSEPTTITYPTWSQYNTYSVGSKVSQGGKNYQCTYWDSNSTYRAQSPSGSNWWKQIARTTSGAAVLVTLAAGVDLYFVEDVDSTWYKMSTYYGVVGYIKKSAVVYDRHLTPSETKPRIITEQLFRIEKPTVDTKNRTVTVNAKHVSYDLSGVLIRDVSIAQASPAMALGRIVEGFMMDYRGDIATNLTSANNGTYTGDIKGKNGIYALLDPDSGIVSSFNAAYKRDNWDLFVMTKNSIDRGYRIKYRKNMLGVNWAQDSSGLVTRVVPVAKDESGADLYLPETWVDSSRINQYPVIKMERLTVKGQVGKDKGKGDDSTWTESDLLAEMRTKAGERFSVDQADQISVTVTVDFEQLGDTDEYKALKGMENVLLYDTVTVENDEIGLTVQLYVSEWEWDAIRKKTVALKLVNTMDYQKGNVTGYNVQSKSIGAEKLMDDVAGEIMQQVTDIIPEYADPSAARPASSVNVTDSDTTLSWGTRSKVATIQGNDIHVTMPSNPDTWRPVVDNLTSTDTDKSLSANQGMILNSKIAVVSKNITYGESFTSGQIKECIFDISDLKQTYSEVYLINFAGVSGSNYNSFQFCYGYSTSNNRYSVGMRNNSTSAQTASSFDVQFLCIK
jgi:phage minor structural protein